MSKWCIYIVVLIQSPIGKNLDLSYQRDHIFIKSKNLLIAIYAFPMHVLTSPSVDEILNWYSDFRVSHLKWKWFLLVKNICTQSSCTGKYLLQLAPGNAAGIQLRQLYLWEALDHLCSLYLTEFLRDIANFLSFLMWNHFLLFDLTTFEVCRLGKIWTRMVLMYSFTILQRPTSKK